MSGKIPEDFISSLVGRIDIVEIISSRITLRKAGTNFSAKCPFHNEKTPSFSVNSNKQFYHCFGCGAHGDVIKFIMEYDKLSFVETIEDLASRIGLSVPYEQYNVAKNNSQEDGDHTANKNTVAAVYQLLTVASKYYIKQLKEHQAAANAVAYLKQRGLTGEIAKEFGIGYAPPGWENLKHYILHNSVDSFDEAILAQAGLSITSNASGNNVNNNNTSTAASAGHTSAVTAGTSSSAVDNAGIGVGSNKPSPKLVQRTYDRFRNRIMFPIRDRRGRVIGFGGRVIDQSDPKYLNSPETVVFHKGEELYGLYEANKKVRKITFLVVVEGYLDVIALHQAGIYEVVATLGTALTPEHLKLLFRLAPEIVFCFDADQAGYKAAIRSLELTLPSMHGGNKVNFMFLPQGEDPDSFVRSKGKDAFLQEVERAMPLADFLFSELSKNANLEVVEDRAQIALKGKAWIEQMPTGVFQQLMYDRLARLIGIDGQILSGDRIARGNGQASTGWNGQGNSGYSGINSKTHYVNTGRSSGAYGSAKNGNLPEQWQRNTSNRVAQPPKSPAMVALALLLADRSLLDEIAESLEAYQAADFPGIKLLIAVVAVLRENKAFTVEQVKDSLPAVLGRHFVASELSSLVALVPAQGVREEFLGALAKIRDRQRELDLEILLRKAKQEGLTTEDKVRLQHLLTENSDAS